MNARTNSRQLANRGRRKGIAMVYVALTMTMIIGIAAYSIDMAWLYSRKTVAQKAADAAALAGAWEHANFHPLDANGKAIYYASLPDNGGYNTAKTGTSVTIEYPAVDKAANVTRPNWYRVTVKRPEPTFFAQIFGSRFRTVTIGATATALYQTLADLNINGGGTYGKAPGAVNLSLFGPEGNYNNGDCYSVKFLPNGQPNPLYTGTGYDFTVKLDANMRSKSKVYFQIFDPDCYNKSGANADGKNAVDEYRGSGEGTTTYRDATTTRYRLYYDNNTPYNLSDDVLVKDTSWGNQSATDLIWAEFADVDPDSYGTGSFRINVLSTDGGSENGFDLRVSDTPALGAASQRLGYDNFNPSNGSSITAQGHMPMNFNQNGTVTITLGDVPVQAAGGQLQIRKFDTDVGAKSIIYKCSSLPGQQWSGTLSSNGTFATDTIQVPSTYSTQGTWTATYAAGLGDTSVWDMSYSNYGPGRPGGIRLIE